LENAEETLCGQSGQFRGKVWTQTCRQIQISFECLSHVSERCVRCAYR